MNTKISIAIPVWNRRHLLYRTLQRIEDQVSTGGQLSVEISIYEDEYKPEENLSVEQLRNDFPKLSFVYEMGEHRDIPKCPVYATNRAVKNSTGDILVVQAAEVYHLSSILLEAKLWAKSWKEGEHYFAVAPCIHLDQEMSDSFLAGRIDLKDDLSQVQACKEISKSYVNPVAKMRWSAHPIYAKYPLSQLLLMPRATWDYVGGFSKEFDKGQSWADQDFLMKVWEKRIKTKWLKGSVVHLFHGENYTSQDQIDAGEKSRAIFEKKWKIKGSFLPRFFEQQRGSLVSV